jgi:glycosyltransferase involved in cell wall biosynthesis
VRAATIHKYALPEQFFFYPAVTWPHKNHEIIIRALHQLKTRLGKTPDVFFTGATTDFRSMLDGSARELGVSAQLHYLGFVTADELQTIYHMATAMVFPSKFEGFGLPILEAFHSRLPVLCSSATTLPEIAGGAALFFDPDKPEDLSTLLDKVLGDASLRQSMIEKGSKTLAQYSIKRTAAEFQALYHQLITKQKMVESQTAAAMQNGEL